MLLLYQIQRHKGINMKDTILKQFEHFSKLAKNGIDTSNPVRNELVKSDAKRHLDKMIEKFPYLAGKEEPKVEVKEEVKPTKKGVSKK